MTDPRQFADLRALVGHLRRELENKKYILLFAYNGTGKTRLSMAFKDAGKQGDAGDTLYYNAFTEDLFTWDNDLENDSERVLKLNSASRFFAGLETLEMEIGLPANLFYSTGIPVCILVLKKCKKPDDVLFINASEHFAKDKRQNRLLPEHIDKIIDTYQFRKKEERYARRVSMEEIEENGYNLNISRYISTAISEKEIDLGAVNRELVALEEKVVAATKKHNEFLKELGLPPLPGA